MLPCPVYTAYRWASVIVGILGFIEFGVWYQLEWLPTDMLGLVFTAYISLRLILGITKLVFHVGALIPATYCVCAARYTLRLMYFNHREEYYDQLHICTIVLTIFTALSVMVTTGLVHRHPDASLLWGMELGSAMYWSYVCTLRYTALCCGTTAEWFRLRWPPMPVVPNHQAVVLTEIETTPRPAVE